MRPRAFSILTVLVFIGFFLLCGSLLMACMDMFDHYGLLTSSIPVQAFVAIILLAAVSAVSLVLVMNGLGTGYHAVSDAPDIPLWRPLTLAFSDGILHPKLYA